MWELRVPLPFDPVSGRYGQRSVSYRGTKRAAEIELARLITEADRTKQSGTQAAFATLIEQWWELKQPRLSPATAREYQRLIDRRVLPGLGRIKVAKLGAAELDRYYARLATDGLAPASVRQIHAIVSGSLGQAVKWGWLHTNPARDATLPQARRTPIEPPTPTKVRLLLNEAEQHSPEFGLFIRLAAALGCRRGEVCGLRWSDIDLDNRTATIHRSVIDVAGVLHIKDTKTHQIRRVSIDSDTCDHVATHHHYVLDRAAAAGIELNTDAYLLSEWPDGAKPMRPDKATNTFRLLRTKVGLPDARLHDLRHFMATQLIGSGHDIRTVAGRLGHAQTSTTLNVYAAFLQQQDRQAADTLGNLLRNPQ